MRNYIIEFIGTFFLVLIIGLTGNPLAIGVGLIALVYMGGHISGAHYNPAVTFAVFLRKKISFNDALMYMLYQFSGAIAAALIFYLIKGSTFAPAPAPEASNMSSLLVEILFTFALVLVILNVATSKKTAGNNFYGIAIGLTVMAAAFAGGPISGGAFNPAVGLGPIVIDVLISGNSLTNLALYLVGPLVGSIMAVLIYRSTCPEEMLD